MLEQQVVNGVMLGSVYALIAVAFTLAIGVLNLSIGATLDTSASFSALKKNSHDAAPAAPASRMKRLALELIAGSLAQPRVAVIKPTKSTVMTMLRMAVPRFGSTSLSPGLAKIPTRAAQTADSSA